MIIKGSERGGGQNLAAHLMNEFTNDRVEVAELDGAVAPDLHGAFAEWFAQSKATKGKKYLFSLSVNPDERQRRLTREEYIEFADRVGRKLKLDGRPRAVVIHEKADKKGIIRQHAHIVWSRTDTEKQKLVPLGRFKNQLRGVVRDFAKDHDLQLPPGMRKDGLRDRFDRAAEVSKLPETQQEERSGLPKIDRVAAITALWHETKTGEDFVRALAAQDYYLARGDKVDYVIIDLAGEVHGLSRQIKGVRIKPIRERLAAFPPEQLPDVEKAQAHAAEVRAHRLKKIQNERTKDLQKTLAPVAPEGPTPDERRADLREQHRKRRLALDAQRETLNLRHAQEAGALAVLQATVNAGIVTARNEKKPTGLTAFVLRITGVTLIRERGEKREDKERQQQKKIQEAALMRRQDSERRDTDRGRRAVGRVERREWRSLETALRREEFQKIAAPARDREKTGDTGKNRPPEKEGYVLTPEQAAKLAAFGDAGRDMAAKPPPKPPKKPSRLAGIFNRLAPVKNPLPTRPPEKPELQKPDPRAPEPEDALRGEFNAASGGATPEPPAPEATPEPDTDSLASQFRRAAENRDRGRDIDDPDNGREKNYRRQSPDLNIRR